MTDINFWVHNLNPVLLHIYGPLAIRYYGLSYILGFIFAFWMMKKMALKGLLPLNADQQATAMTSIILGVFLGGRIGYILFYNLDNFLSNPLILFKIWEGGMASHGGFIGVFLAAWWIARKYSIPYFKLIDLIAVMTPAGLMLGRIANFINGELWGKIATVPWAIIFPTSMPSGTALSNIPARHPSQLYEAALEGLLLIIYTQLRLWKTRVTAHPGQLAGEFILLYALVRVFVEQFREPDAALMLNLSRGTFYSLFMLLGGILLIWLARRSTTRK